MIQVIFKSIILPLLVAIGINLIRIIIFEIREFISLKRIERKNIKVGRKDRC